MPHDHHHPHGYKFNPHMLERLRDPERLRFMDPEAVWGVLAMQPGGTLVDVGAGLGFYAIPFARKLGSGTVYACDQSAEMLEHLRGEIAREGAANVTPVQTEEVKIPLPDGVADRVLMSNLHHELDHPQESLAECRRLLKAGGKIVIVDWKPEPTPKGPPAEVRIPPATVQAQLASAGFREIAEHALLPYHYVISAVA